MSDRSDQDRELLALAERVFEAHRPVAEKPERRAWHLVQTAGGDGKAIDWLDRCGIDHYYPQVRELRPVPRKQLSRKQRASGIPIMRPRLVALFPGYLFVHFDRQGGAWREIFDFAGIGGLVSADGRPVRVPDEMVAGIRAREIGGAVPGKTPAALIFHLGERVRVADGPFSPFEAIVEKLPRVSIEEIDAATRIRVAVDIFGRATPVDLEVSQIEKL